MAEIDKARVREFSAKVHHQVQQTNSRLRPYVKIKQFSANDFAYDGLGDVELQELYGRYNKIEWSEIPHNRRKLSRRRFGRAIPLDKMDINGVLQDPQGEYSMALAKAIQRRFDRTILEAVFADVLTGENFETTVDFATDGGQTVTATAGLTYEKLLEIRKNYIDKEVGNEEDLDMIFCISGDENTALMGEIELVSGDYSRQFAVDNKRQIEYACGLKLVKFGGGVQNPMLTVSGGVRNCVVMTRGAICLGLQDEFDIKYQPRNDYYDTDQLVVSGFMGAVRTEGVLIQKVTTTD